MSTKAAEWLRNVLEYAVMETSLLGSVTIAAATVIGTRLAYINVGDCAVLVFRKMQVIGSYMEISHTPSQHVMNHDPATGASWEAPRQISVYQPQSRREAARLCVQHANFNAMTIQKDDVVVVCSDGVTDNLSRDELRNIVEAGMTESLGPYGLAQEIVELAIGTGRKPDDTSAFVGIVTETWY